MSAQSDYAYFERRSAQEWEAARRARDTGASVVHSKLARCYQERAAQARDEETVVRITTPPRDAG